MVEVRDVAPGLWLWRQPHPAWREGLDWEPEVSSFVVESQGETILLDPLAPHPRERQVWERLDGAPPTVVVVMKPDHVRDVDLFARWYGARAYGPDLYFRGDGPKTELQPILPGDPLPGGLRTVYQRVGKYERPLLGEIHRRLRSATSVERRRCLSARPGIPLERCFEIATRMDRLPVRDQDMFEGELEELAQGRQRSLLEPRDVPHSKRSARGRHPP